MLKSFIFVSSIFFVAVLAFALGAFVYVMFARLDYALATDLNLTLFGDYRAGYEAMQRLSPGITHGAYHYSIPSGSTNVARVVGLLAFCIIPYFFCPKVKPAKK